MIGDPPNIMIGSEAKLSFVAFLFNDGIPCMFILIVLLLFMKLIYGRKLVAGDGAVEKIMLLDERKEIRDPRLMKQSIVMILLIVAGFVLHDQFGYDTAFVALTAAAVMLLIGGVDVEEAVSNVEWPTLLFFMGLFVLVGALEKVGIIEAMAKFIMTVTRGHDILTMMVLLWASALLSSVLDNIPFVATMIPLIQNMGAMGVSNLDPIWWSLALGACLGGNGTLVGASANLIVAGLAAERGVKITFVNYFKVGFPVMLLTILLSTVYVYLRYL